MANASTKKKKKQERERKNSPCDANSNIYQRFSTLSLLLLSTRLLLLCVGFNDCTNRFVCLCVRVCVCVCVCLCNCMCMRSCYIPLCIYIYICFILFEGHCLSAAISQPCVKILLKSQCYAVYASVRIICNI